MLDLPWRGNLAHLGRLRLRHRGTVRPVDHDLPEKDTGCPGSLLYRKTQVAGFLAGGGMFEGNVLEITGRGALARVRQGGHWAILFPVETGGNLDRFHLEVRLALESQQGDFGNVPGFAEVGYNLDASIVLDALRSGIGGVPVRKGVPLRVPMFAVRLQAGFVLEG